MLPRRILTRALIEWPTPDWVRPDAIINCVRAYRSHGGRGVIDDVTDFGYASAAFLNYLYELVTSFTDDHERRNGSAEVVAALTSPLDRRTLGDALDAVRAIG